MSANWRTINGTGSKAQIIEAKRSDSAVETSSIFGCEIRIPLTDAVLTISSAESNSLKYFLLYIIDYYKFLY